MPIGGRRPKQHEVRLLDHGAGPNNLSCIYIYGKSLITYSNKRFVNITPKNVNLQGPVAVHKEQLDDTAVVNLQTSQIYHVHRTKFELQSRVECSKAYQRIRTSRHNLSHYIGRTSSWKLSQQARAPPEYLTYIQQPKQSKHVL